jgi:hypothetical protein
MRLLCDFAALDSWLQLRSHCNCLFAHRSGITLELLAGTKGAEGFGGDPQQLADGDQRLVLGLAEEGACFKSFAGLCQASVIGPDELQGGQKLADVFGAYGALDVLTLAQAGLQAIAAAYDVTAPEQQSGQNYQDDQCTDLYWGHHVVCS